MVQKKMMRVLLLLLLALGSANTAQAVPVAGKVTLGGQGEAGVRVRAYRLDIRDFSGEPAASSTPSDAGGKFALDLPPGGYYFFAEGADLFTYYGRNPVTLTAEGLEGLNFALVRAEAPGPAAEVMIDEGVAGQVSYQGKPLAGVVISLYTDLSSQLKGMSYGMSAPTGADGYFELPMPPGTYFLVARKRANGQISGPLSAGDFFGYYPKNPLVVKVQEVARIGVPMVEVPEKVALLADSMFGSTSIHGRVLNAVGSPVPGVRVLLYADSSMFNRPLYVSQPSDANGEYVLSFPKGGTYFLAARNKLGGAPAPGELYGRYSANQDSSIRIRTGQALTGIDMLVQEMW
jgi:hypothetical protein